MDKKKQKPDLELLNTDYIMEQLAYQQDCMAIDNILDIYNGWFSDYEDYAKFVEKLIKQITDKNKDNMLFSLKHGTYKLKYYQKPQPIRKDLFDYIKEKGENDRLLKEVKM